jgi:hypothetical protein
MDGAWSDGTNTAGCHLARQSRPDRGHDVVPDPDCTCGFYAYADEEAGDDSTPADTEPA